MKILTKSKIHFKKGDWVKLNEFSSSYEYWEQERVRTGVTIVYKVSCIRNEKVMGMYEKSGIEYYLVPLENIKSLTVVGYEDNLNLSLYKKFE